MTQVPPPDSPTEVSIDAVSSLRAAALSTLRMKRKKASDSFSKTTISSRSEIPQNSLTLDYGAEEPSNATSPISDETATQEATDKQEDQPNASIEDSREEGEISDEEDSPAGNIDAARISHDLGKTSIVEEKDSSRTKSPSPATSRREKNEVSVTVQVHKHQHPLIDEQHVRPGLTMSIDQLNMVKELVLDLLGWGVAPEYLVECGLTRHAIYYAFTELNLKLPKNLDTTGIDPYPFPRPSVATTDSDTINASDASYKDTSPRRPTSGHPLPAKPVAARSPTFGTDRKSRSPSDGSEQVLLDIEAQKRQELLARRAVLASRKKSGFPTPNSEASPSYDFVSNMDSKQSDSAYLSASSDPLAESTRVVPLENIDDFLNSMISETSLPPKLRSRVIEPSTSKFGHPERMELDNPPSAETNDVVRNGDVSKTTLSPDAPVFHPANSTPKSTSGDNPESLLIQSHSHSPTPVELLPAADSSIDSKASTSSTINTQSNLNRDTSLPPSQSSNTSVPARRGTKRPVASDFVDVEMQSSSLPRSSSFNPPVPPPHVRRKIGGFAGLNGHGTRRCVIDLSDSEDGEDDPGGGSGAGEPDSRHRPMSRNSAPIQSPRPVRSLPSSSMSKPTSMGPSPSELLKKEQQIQRMKEIIARREQERLKKLDAVIVWPVMLRLLHIQKAPSPVQIDPTNSSPATVQSIAELRESSVTVSISSTELPFESEGKMVVDDVQIDNLDDILTASSSKISDPDNEDPEIYASGSQQLLTSEADNEQLARSSFLRSPDYGLINVSSS
ncbi:hypothetical protein SCHPADRAFT_944553 [Schizopora paradoxa]|uniref:Uncharacterized protein n=1 Tax=Schizopora paradoxa TaxID=27342 RepID=A0A0H2RFK2_9AGAM|nr:hypothetical protein SCHPADRAFT_944553 [Schizopora paradoxa]